MKRTKLYVTFLCLSFFILTPNVWAKSDASKKYCSSDVCGSQVPALIGGCVSDNESTLTLRWLGAANMELTYNNQIILLSAYYDVKPRAEHVIDPDDVVQADYIFLGHGHSDHMADTAQIAKQTGATVFGEHITYNRLRNLDYDGNTYKSRSGNPSPYEPLPESQLKLLKDGDIVQLDGFTVEAVHVFHSGVDAPDGPKSPTKEETGALSAYGDSAWGGMPFTDEENAHMKALEEKSAGDKRIATEGVLAYLFTFGKDFTLIFYDSASSVTSESLTAAMKRIGNKSDVAMVAYAGGHSHTQVPYTMVPLKVLNPRLFIPEHHDGGRYEMVTEKLFQTIRDEMSNTQSLSLLYKEPVCFDVKSHVATKTSPLGDVWRYGMK